MNADASYFPFRLPFLSPSPSRALASPWEPTPTPTPGRCAIAVHATYVGDLDAVVVPSAERVTCPASDCHCTSAQADRRPKRGN